MNIQIVCGDSIILWRCFLVWNKDFSVIAIPFFMVLGTAGTLWDLKSLPIFFFFFDIHFFLKKSPDMVLLLNTSFQILMCHRLLNGLRVCFLFPWSQISWLLDSQPEESGTSLFNDNSFLLLLVSTVKKNFFFFFFWRYVARDLDAKYFGASLRRYRFVIVLIVESGAIMAISKVIEFTLFKLAPDDGLNGLNALYIPMDCMPQIMVSSLFIL